MQNYFYHDRHEKEMTFYRNYFHTAYEIYYVREINTMRTHTMGRKGSVYDNF